MSDAVQELDRVLDALAARVAARITAKIAARLAIESEREAVCGLFTALDAAGADLDCARAHAEFLDARCSVIPPPPPQDRKAARHRSDAPDRSRRR